MRKIALLIGVVFTFHVHADDTKRFSNQDYIAMWSNIAMEEMMNHKIPASITLAQGLLESGSGNSDLARLANNHFGIKCHEWTGDKIYKDDDAKNECFRKYESAELSFIDHSQFLTGKKRYENLFYLDITDYKSWAKGLKAAGYATNPKYPDLLINLIEKLQLYDFDRFVINNPNSNNILVSNKTEGKDTKELKETTDKQHSKHTTQSKKNSTTKNSEVEVHVGKTRETFIHDNKVKYVIAKKGDTFYKIAEEFGITLAQIQNYNDVKNGNTTIKEGDIVNIFPKHSKGKVDSKQFDKELTILEIAQLEGIKVKSLMKLNGLLDANTRISKGEEVRLK